MKNKHSVLCLTSILVLLLTLNSCIGLSLSIQMNKDGSGRLTMEYRISKMLTSLGSLDGNDSMPSVPLGKEDWENTVSRIPGAKLVSYTSVEENQDTVIKAVIDFKDDQSLLALLDPVGEKILINRQGQSGKLDLILLKEPLDDSSYDKDVMAMMRIFMDGYFYTVNFSGPGNSTLVVTDGLGNAVPVQSSAKAVLSGRSVSYSIGILDLLDTKDGIGFRFNW